MPTSQRTLFLALVAAAGLAGCGGGDGDVTAPPPTVSGSDVPQSAMSSAQAFTSYVGTVPASDTAEPLALGDISPPTSDTDEPQALP